MSLVMDFIEKALPTAGAVIGGIGGEALDVFGGGVVGASAGSAAGQWLSNELSGKPGGQNVATAALGGAVGQGVGGAIGDFASGLAPEAASVGGKILTKVGAGAAVGGGSSTAAAVAEGQRNPKSLAMDFLQGAGIGAATGGIVEGGKQFNDAHPLNDIGAVGNNVNGASDLFSQEDLQKIADSTDPKEIAKIIEPVTGETLAPEAAQSIAADTDPNTVKNHIDNIVEEKLRPALDAQAQQIANTPLTPATPTSDVNTPQQVAENAATIQPTPPTQEELTPEQASLAAKAPEPSVTDKPGVNELQSLAEKQPGPDELAQQGSDITAAPAEPRDFMNNPKSLNEAKYPNLKTHVGELNGMAEMQQVANGGGTPGEAMDKYIEQTGATRPEAQAAWDKMYKEANPNGGLLKGMVNSKLNPEFERASTLTPETQRGDIEQPIKNTRTVVNEVTRLQQAGMDNLDKLSENDMKLMDNARGKSLQDVIGQAEDKQAFTDAFNAVRKFDDFIQGSESGAMGGNVPYMQNHGIQMFWKQADQEPNGIANLSRNPGQANARNFKNYDDPNALQAGLERQNDNFMGDFLQASNAAKSRLAQLEMEKGLSQAYPGKVQISRIGQDESGLYKQLNIPYANKLSVPSAIADEINKRAPAMPDGKGWTGYDKLNSNWKNLKLAGGGFHSVNVMGSFVAHQIASGNFFKNPGDTLDMIKSTLSDSAYKQSVNQWESSGRLLDMDAAGLVGAKNAGLDVSNTEGDVKGSGRLGDLPVIKQLHEAIFERQIPFMKMKIFDQLTQGMDRNKPEDLQQMTSIAKQLNNAFGGLNRDIQGLSPATFKKMSRAFLATDYNEGQLRTLGNAFTDGGASGKLARQIVFGKAALFGGLATLGGLAGGEFKGQTPKQVALDIMHKAIDPSFKFGNYTVGLPTTQLSELGKPLGSLGANAYADYLSGNPAESGKSLKSPIENFASARLAAIPSGIEQFASNKNFYNQPIHGTDYYGRPISAGTTLANLIGDVAPIPVTQALQTGQGNESTGAAIANVVGLRATLTNNMDYSPVAAQTYIQQLEQTPGVSKQQVQADTQFVAALGAGDTGRSKVLKAATGILAQAQKSGDTKQIQAAPAKVQTLINEYNQQLAKALLPWAQSPSAKFMDSNMLQLLRSTMITYKNAQSNVNYDIKTNPTAYGVKVQPLTSAPNVVGG